MNLPCSVIRDLLPLTVENLACGESAALVREHIENCAACREYMETLRAPAEPAPESPAPMKLLKKELRRRRWHTAAIAALSVFAVLFAVLARATDKEPLEYSPELIRAEGAEAYDPDDFVYSGAVSSFRPEGWQTALPGQALVIERSPRVSGVDSQCFLDEETGELTVFLQYYTSPFSRLFRGTDGPVSASSGALVTVKDVFCPVPDRVIYGFGQEQTLLWGEPMKNGGVQILPRLALGYYVLLSACLAAVLAVLWVIFRWKRVGPVLLQLFFVPAAYLLGSLFVKGLRTVSFFLLRDFGMICAEAAVFYALLTLCRLALARRKRDGG